MRRYLTLRRRNWAKNGGSGSINGKSRSRSGSIIGKSRSRSGSIIGKSRSRSGSIIGKSRSRSGSSTTRRHRQTQAHFANIPGRTKRFLAQLCPNVGMCVSLQLYPTQISAYYDHFTTSSNYLIEPIRRIGAASANGFVYELWYERDGYKTATVLKSAATKDNDQLLYEGMIGIHFINALTERFLCFIRTYQMYEHQNRNIYNLMLHGNNVRKNDLFRAMKPLQYKNTSEFINNYACTIPDKVAVHIEHIHRAMTLGDFIKIAPNDDVLATILYQVYKPLSVLSAVFTHYDLHTNNIMLYKIPDNNWVRLVYMEGGREVAAFNTQYIAKIIDYGRCYTPISNDFVSKLNPTCRDLHFFEPTLNSTYSYISGIINNSSHDLRAANMCGSTFNAGGSILVAILKRIKYDDEFGTPRVPSNTHATSTSGSIHTVSDLARILEIILPSTNAVIQSAPMQPVCTITSDMDIDGKPMNVQFRDAAGPKMPLAPDSNPPKMPTEMSINLDNMRQLQTPQIIEYINTTINWIYDISRVHRASIDQFALACYILLHELQLKPIKKTNIQLTACAAMFVAGIGQSDITEAAYDFRDLSGGAYTKSSLMIEFTNMKTFYNDAWFQMSPVHLQAIADAIPLTYSTKSRVIALFNPSIPSNYAI